VSWSVIALHVCRVLELEKPTQTNIAARSTSLKHILSVALQKEIQCKPQSFLSQDSDDIAVTLACEGLCGGV